MSYILKNVHNVSKFRILSFNRLYLSESAPTVWWEFWKFFFTVEKLDDFFSDKFNTYQKFHLSEKEFFYYEIDRDFIIKKLPDVIKNIDFLSWKIKPNAEDVFWSYRIFNTILGYYNTYYSKSFISLNLSIGISFSKKYDNINDLLDVADFYQQTPFFKEIITPIYKKIYEDNNEKILYRFWIYWPDELILIISLTQYLKCNKNSKILLDLSSGNEQYDFSQWKEFIFNNNKIFSCIDYFVIDKDYWKSINSILWLLNWNNETDDKISNIIYKSNNAIIYNYLKEDDLGWFEQSNNSIFSLSGIYTLGWKKSITSRLAPYKCYWNKCNFCAINSQNKLSIHKKYDYQYYIKRWIDFIKTNKIEHVSFIDEAIPPLVLFNLAKALIENNLKITYFLRTRIERFYQPWTLKIIEESWARFWWMWLESASDDTNELIGNKWNWGLSIKEKWVLVRDMDRMWISVHNYAILWFPWEEEKDYLKTYVFLKNNIIHSRQYTCSPNIFRLMKGPEIFQHRDKYGIKLDEWESKSEFSLSYNFTVNWKKRNMWLLNKLVNDLHRIQFAPWLSREVSFINYEDLWAYIDRSEIFYIMKNLYKDSSYYSYKNINNFVINKSLEDIKFLYFNKSNYYVSINETNTSENTKVYDWISCKHVTISNITYNFIETYIENITLIDNLNKYNKNDFILINKDINLLFDAKILKYYK
jgi:hypothetical protein